MKHLHTLLFLTITYFYSHAQYGYLDSSYANNGKQNYPDFNPYLYYDKGLTLIERSAGSFMLVGDVLKVKEDGVWLPILHFANDLATGEKLALLGSPATYNMKCAVIFGGEQSDKFLIGGSKNGDVFIKKFDGEGNIDLNFGHFGEVLEDLGGTDVVRSMERLSNGHYYVVIRSQSSLIIRKLKSDGSWDLVFGNDGQVEFPVNSEYKIVTAVNSGDDLFLTTSIDQISKISKTGQVDVSYSSIANLYLDLTITHLLPLEGGSLLVSGNEFISQQSLIIQKLKPNGEQDNSFGTNSKAVVNYNGKFNSISDVQLFGSRLYVFGDIDQDFLLAQLSDSGELVTSFGNNGKLIVEFGASLAYGLKLRLSSNGKALMLGVRQDWLGMARAVISESPVVSAYASVASVCRGTQFQLFGEGAATYHWTGSNGFSSDEQNPLVTIPESFGGSQVLFTMTGYNADGFSSQALVVVDLKSKIQADYSEQLPCFGVTTGHRVTIYKNNFFDEKTIAQYDDTRAQVVSEDASEITFSFDAVNSPLQLNLHDTSDRYCDLPLTFGFKTHEEISARLETTTVDSTCISVITPDDESVPLTYIWSNGATSKIASGLEAGAFSVTVTNTETGCSAVFEDECIPETSATAAQILPGSVFPNPVSNELFVAAGAAIVKVSMTDAGGRIMHAGCDITGKNIRIDCAHLNPGLYQLMLTDAGGKTLRARFIKI